MGEQLVKKINNFQQHKSFTKALLNDVKALDLMLEKGLFEKGIQRIGSEQELCLLDRNFNPSTKGEEILERIREKQYTSELARYNLEVNLDPQVLTNNCFSKVKDQLEYMLKIGADASHHFRNKILLTGILPTIRRTHLNANYMMPKQRYKALSDSFFDLRGENFEIYLQGVDELISSLNSVLFEACNTSFQLHLQIDPKDFVAQYNWAQAIAGPVLSVSTNSPLLMGRELWNETRIALFKQSLDTRSSRNQLRDKMPRVYFGNEWIENSVTDVFKNQIARFPSIITASLTEDSLAILENGDIPKLKALMLHNGTSYAWNRPCYGVAEGVAHLRIESRYLPSGPSVEDEIANFVFWVGLMKVMPEQFEKMKGDFRIAKSNFINAARVGMKTGLEWNGKSYRAPKLIGDYLIPMASKGLASVGVDASDINHYLGIIDGRCSKEVDGSTWQIKNFRKLKDRYGMGKALSILTEEMYNRQQSGEPVYKWSDIKLSGALANEMSTITASKIMNTDLFTIKEKDFVALASDIMKWRDIRHLPVENDKGELRGLITATNLKNLAESGEDPYLEASEIMVKELHTINPEASIEEIRQLMFEYQIRCLPVLVEGKLVGLITDTDVTKLEIKD